MMEIELALDAGHALAGSKKVEQAMGKSMTSIRKKTELLDHRLRDMHKKLLPATKAWEKATKKVERAEVALAKIANKAGRDGAALRRALVTATAAETITIYRQIDAMEERYKVAVKEQKTRLAIAHIKVGTAGAAKEKEEGGAKAVAEFAAYDFSDSGKDMFEGFKDGISALSGKDLGGMIKGITSGIGAGLKGVGAGITRGVAKGAEGAGPMAGMFKAIAPMLKSLGPMLQMLGKMGPLLGALSSSIVGIIKLFVDAEAAAKDFNKNIMETAGSGQFLHDSMNNATAGADALDKTLKKIYDQSTSLDNLNWGINKSTHQAVLNSLNAEGVSLQRLEQDFANTAKGAQDAAGHAKDFGSTVQMAVAYSKKFGVSLQEITAMQSEMMTEQGMSLSTVQKQFSSMSKGAEEAGIASNKFFGIIRGISADLNLYNTRMEDAVHMLTQLGKVMSPKNAAKFMQASTGALKNMGRTERLKVALLSGGKAGAVVDRDIKRHSSALAERIGDATKGAFSPEEIAKAVESGGADLQKILAAAPKEMAGELREAQLELKMKQGMRKGGVFGTGLAAGEAGPAAQLQILTDSLKGFNGGKTLMGGIGEIGQQMMAENLGISIEQLNHMAKFEVAMNDQRDVLKKSFKTDEKLQKKLSKIMGHDVKDAAEIDKLGYDQLMDTMDKDAQDQLKQGETDMDFAKKTAHSTSSMLDKLETIMDWIMNQVYNVMIGIWDTVSGMFDLMPGSGDSAKFAKMEIAAAKTRNKDVMAAVGASGGDLFKMKDALIGGEGMKNVVAAINKDATTNEDKKKQDALFQAMQKSATKEQLKKAADMAGVGGKIEGGTTVTPEEAAKIAAAVKQKEYAAVATGARGEGATEEDAQRVSNAFVKSIRGQEEIAKATKEFQQQKEEKFFTDLRKNMGDDDYKKLLTKLGWATDPEALSKAFPDWQKAAAGTATPEAQAKAVAEGQTKASPDGAKAATAAVTGGSIYTHDMTAEGAFEELIEILTESDSTLGDIYKALRVKGVRMDWKFHKDDAEEIIEKGVLEGSRQSLLEYMLYSKLGEEEIVGALKSGISPKDIGKGIVKSVTESGSTAKEALDGMTKAQGNAAGGIPMRPANGEVFASIKPLSEAIVPLDKLGGGGGGAVIELRTTGDLTRFIDARVIDGNVKFNKNAKTR